MRFRLPFSGWTLGMMLVLGLVLVPAGYIAIALLEPSSEGWRQIAKHLLAGYLWNTLQLLLGVGGLSLVMAVPTAWLTTAYHFPGSRYFDWLLMLPLAVPTYIAATVYADMSSYTGTFQQFYHWWFPGEPLPFDMMTMSGAVLVIASVLYPYAYIMSRASFRQQSQTLIEAARLLGAGVGGAFWRVALPLARPAVAGSLFLIMMEVLNEYGTVKYYGISTFTTGIFKAWLSMGDRSAAIRLAACLLLFVLLLMGLERWQRGRSQYAAGPKSQRPFAKTALRGWKGWLASLYCLMPVLLGFGIPVAQLLYWAWKTGGKALTPEFGQWVVNTLWVGAIAALLTIMAALILVYGARLSKSSKMRYVAKLGTLGYAVPGAVIAVGIMAAFIQADALANWLSLALGGAKVGLLFSGTLTALIVAYIIRFLAIAYNPLEAGFEKTAQRFDEASRALGKGPMATLWRVDLPLLRTVLLSAILMVVIEVMKELPLTLILRPFNFDTLATKAFELASDEQIQASSSTALLIVLAGIIPVLSLIRMMDKSSR